MDELWKNGQTDRDVTWDVDSFGSKNHVRFDMFPDYSTRMGNFEGVTSGCFKFYLCLIL